MRILEARDRPGGRILSSGGFDHGPAWIWPGQRRIEALLHRLGLAPFEQYSSGDLIHEDAAGAVQRVRGQSGMAGALRVPGGLGAVTDALADQLTPAILRLSCPVKRIEIGTGRIRLHLDDTILETDKCVVALPPRLAADLLSSDIDADRLAALRSVPTWMAGHAKATAIYEQPFWRTEGFSGDAFSRRGPMVELHDASVPNGPAALFGFLGVPPSARRDTDRLRSAVLDQFVRLFGPKASTPEALHIQDWAFDPFTATPADHTSPPGHPYYGPLPDPVRGRLLLCGTEMSMIHGGLVEGALAAAENTFARLTGLSVARASA